MSLRFKMPRCVDTPNSCSTAKAFSSSRRPDVMDLGREERIVPTLDKQP